MHTISAPKNRWGPPSYRAERYAPTRPNGKRVPGWEDVNITHLAEDMGVSFRYLLAVLCGQRNCTLALLQHAARTLGIELTTLIGRMERAYNLRQQAAANTPTKAEKRRTRSEKRALQQRG